MFVPHGPERNPWLLLIHQLPREPAYLRVKVGRRLARVGAIALKNSVYVLPRTDNTLEDFQWIRREIVEDGGEATVVEAKLLEGLSDDEAEAKFREAKDAEYAELIREARGLASEPSPRRKRPWSDEERAAVLADVLRLERRVKDIETTDFFGAPGHEVATSLLREIRRKAEPPMPVSTGEPRPAEMHGRTWVTRTGVHVDRIASAWLIVRFIDPEGTFKFVSAKGYAPLEGELRFDMFEAEYSHEGENCTFETLVARFGIDAVGIRAIADVIHDIDLKENKFDRSETAGVAACIAGLCRVERVDEGRLARGFALFDGLLAHFASKGAARR